MRTVIASGIPVVRLSKILVSLALMMGLVSGCATISKVKVAAEVPACCKQHENTTSAHKENTIPGAPLGSDIAQVGYEWQNDFGKTVALESLQGRIQVVSMFFATCQGICLITREDMEKVESSLPKKLREQVGFTLVTLDPKRDSANALKSYRATGNLPVSRWNLLRGDSASTRKLADFLGVSYGPDASGRFVHTSEIVILDTRGRILARHSGVRKDLQMIVSEIKTAVGHNELAID
jgi:protein SCO1/2